MFLQNAFATTNIRWPTLPKLLLYTKALAEGLKCNTALQTLRINNNKISDDSAKASVVFADEWLIDQSS